MWLLLLYALCLEAQLNKYKINPGSIGVTAAAVAAARTHGVRPELSWQSVKQFAPQLAVVAQVLLSITPASGTSERVFSVGCVWNTSRNRLSNTRVRKLLVIWVKTLLRDGPAVDADDLAAFERWTAWEAGFLSWLPTWFCGCLEVVKCCLQLHSV